MHYYFYLWIYHSDNVESFLKTYYNSKSTTNKEIIQNIHSINYVFPDSLMKNYDDNGK